MIYPQEAKHEPCLGRASLIRSTQQQSASTLPQALSRKYPNVGREWPWQWVFPATRTYVCMQSGQRRRHQFYESVVQRGVNEAARSAGISKPASCHSHQHSFATHLFEDGYDIRTVQALHGHRNVSTIMSPTDVLNRGPAAVRSPSDRLPAVAPWPLSVYKNIPGEAGHRRAVYCLAKREANEDENPFSAVPYVEISTWVLSGIY